MNKKHVYDKLRLIEEEYIRLLSDIPSLDHKKIAFLRDDYRKSIEQLSFRDQAYYFFGNQIFSIDAKRGALVCFVVTRDEPNINYLVAKLQAYGFEKIILVDDHSSQSYLSNQRLPSVASRLSVERGSFGLSKVLWIESVCNLFFDGSWVATFDADEFIDIDSIYHSGSTFNSIAKSGRDLKADLLQDSHSVVPFCLLDVSHDELSASKASLLDTTLLYYAGIGHRSMQDYGKTAAVKWSFGKRFTAQYTTDLRYHLYGIAESRSKMSIVMWKTSKKLMLHQGFHSVADRSCGRVYDMEWARKSRVLCKTLIHQKILFTLLNPPYREKLREYFPRTAGNISKLAAILSQKEHRPFSSKDTLHPFCGTMFMPSWTLNGKVIYVEECLLDNGIDALRDDYEFLCIPHNIFRQIIANLHRFVGMRIIRLDRSRLYLQVRNLEAY